MQGDPTQDSSYINPSGLPSMTNTLVSYRTHPASPKTTINRWLETVGLFGADGTPSDPNGASFDGYKFCKSCKTMQGAEEYVNVFGRTRMNCESCAAKQAKCKRKSRAKLAAEKNQLH
ncbi:hypothetical protein JI435_428120 [Parastagonospora nodorum SN15]|uniref:Uncharacterized protein n=1 Tax=Phaeosphaeria nodorum (strain SN15 / ATCC MYA-4574 / FGSC 10173) TaxID=321614 RepID=A0A7U2HXH6_PHANO|nr:hypothetical protein JI435_428120 [Parastagonospora nodorum SN15]